MLCMYHAVRLQPSIAESWQQQQPASSFFDSALAGRHCDSNWYRGNAGELGRRRAPNYTAPAPALLGYDPAVDWHCVQALGSSAQQPPAKMGLCYGGKHAQRCVNANFNILSLMGKTVAYNTCRNCACSNPNRCQPTDALRIGRACLPQSNGWFALPEGNFRGRRDSRCTLQPGRRSK